MYGRRGGGWELLRFKPKGRVVISALHAVPILCAICLQKQLRYISRKKKFASNLLRWVPFGKKYNSTIEYCLHVQSKLSRYISPHFERNAFNSFFSTQKNKFQGNENLIMEFLGNSNITIWKSRNNLEIKFQRKPIQFTVGYFSCEHRKCARDHFSQSPHEYFEFTLY